jgi:hypothetical protein
VTTETVEQGTENQTTPDPVLDPNASQEAATELTEEQKKAAYDGEKQSRVQKRIDKLTREKYEWKGRAEAAERIAAQAQPPEAPQPPKREQFKSDAEYIQASVDFGIAQKLPAIQEELQARMPVVSHGGDFQEKVGKAKAEYADFDDVIEEGDRPYPDHIGEAITSSPVGGHLLYHFAKNTADADRIFALSPIVAAREIGVIEAQILAAKAPKKSSGAPPPVKPVSSSGSVKPDPAKMTDSEWLTWRRTQKLQKVKERLGR